MAKLTQTNQRRSVHPARVFLILKDESVPEEDDDGLNKACSALPHIYWKKEENILLL